MHVENAHTFYLKSMITQDQNVFFALCEDSLLTCNGVLSAQSSVNETMSLK